MVLSLLVSLIPTPVRAQGLPALPELPALPNPGQIGEDLCNAAGDVCDWITYALSLATQLQALMDEFHGEIAGMGEDLYGEATGWLKDSLASVSMGVDVPQVEAAFADIEQAIKEGPSSLLEATLSAVRTLTMQRYAGQNAPANSPDGRFDEMTRTLPNVAAAEVVSAVEQEETAALKAEAASVTETSWKLGAVAQQNTAATDTATTVLAPGGDADTREHGRVDPCRGAGTYRGCGRHDAAQRYLREQPGRIHQGARAAAGDDQLGAATHGAIASG